MRAMNNIAVDRPNTSPGRSSRSSRPPGALERGPGDPRRRPSTARSNRSSTGTLRGAARSLPREFTGEHFKTLTVAEIIAHSSNKGAAQLGMMLGKDQPLPLRASLRLRQPTGFPDGRRGEIRGDLPPPARWDTLTITRMPMGQSVAVTPLQMHQAMGVIASGGLLLRPQIIQRGPGPHRRPRLPLRARRGPPGHPARDRADDGPAADGGRFARGDGRRRRRSPATRSPARPARPRSWRASRRREDRAAVPRQPPCLLVRRLFSRQRARRLRFRSLWTTLTPMPRAAGLGRNVAAPSFKRIAEQLIPYLDIRPAGRPPSRAALAMEGGPPVIGYLVQPTARSSPPAARPPADPPRTLAPRRLFPMAPNLSDPSRRRRDPRRQGQPRAPDLGPRARQPPGRARQPSFSRCPAGGPTAPPSSTRRSAAGPSAVVGPAAAGLRAGPGRPSSRWRTPGPPWPAWRSATTGFPTATSRSSGSPGRTGRPRSPT